MSNYCTIMSRSYSLCCSSRLSRSLNSARNVIRNFCAVCSLTANKDPGRTLSWRFRSVKTVFLIGSRRRNRTVTIDERVRYLGEKPYSGIAQSRSVVAIRYLGFQVCRTAVRSCGSRRCDTRWAILYVETVRYRREILQPT